MPLDPVLLVDTSFFIALANADDTHHQEALLLEEECLKEGKLLVLHWGILFEMLDGFSRRNRRHKAIQLLDRIELEDFRVYSLTDRLVDDAIRLFRERPDKEWGLTDCVSFVLMHQLGLAQALTADSHFLQAGYRALLLET